MTTRGSAIKQATPERLTLLRPMITRRYALVAEHERCCGCRMCATVCPHEAISLSAATVVDGRLTAKARIDIDAARCSFCGECVVVCPTHTLSMTVNEQPEIPVIKAEAFPQLLRQVSVDQAACARSTDVAYLDNCPTGAIRATIRRDAAGAVTAVDEVTVDEERCIQCTRCMEEGPAGAFTVVKPYQGRLTLHAERCPADCQACVDACPTAALRYDGERVQTDRRYCLFCSACEQACPVEGAVSVVRSGFRHTPVESGAWMRAVDKLVSFREVVREYDIKRQEKRRRLVLQDFSSEP